MSLIVNKNAKREYEILKTLVAGIVLSGAEVKSLRLGMASLKGSHISIMNGEAMLINAKINPYAFADNSEYDPSRTRKLLLKKKEIEMLTEASQKKGITIIPIAIFLQRNMLKLELGVGRGKKEYEKRSDLKKRAVERDIRREMKHAVRIK